jgi:ribosomal-protein-serine acetyltransferase
LNRIELRVDTCNHASIAVAERLGFRREGELIQAELIDQVFVDHYIYGLLRQERQKLGPIMDV